ncbi:aldo-keto reductase (AKR) [Sporothrix schenckii 1099-18]|uniref:NADP-dependent oxidoreductase domain-containing protein n=2 Tax=Sporothrix schenckii TaxID=29908 RepID=U7PWL7_SPOS1|nr:aldo-keto reductase (AKR) [Sporothrix schenckii 1099-18]ERT00034.1 hypothetical protein HMPREF1624_03403 [Sporothrix schenckii ATCC 58251]KJR85539.1 aldo-keto reductase (AKR) [Sporothrix schenckii 1099-18]
MASYVTTRGGRTRIPRLVYGTAWKRERTADLVFQAIQTGFRAIDTAAQPRHYREDLVAEGVRRALASGVVASRSDLYIQTKFTAPGGQDLAGPNAPPYDPAAPIADQVRASVESSLRNFTFPLPDPQLAASGSTNPKETSYLDCLVLHSPMDTREDTLAVWTVLQTYVPHRIRSLGISNAGLGELEEVLSVADDVAAAAGVSADTLRPVVVQNRLHNYRHSADPYDVGLRRFCGHPDRRIVYESFWTLTANPTLHNGQVDSGVQAVAAAAGVAPEVAFYSLVALGLGRGSSDDAACPIVILDGTTSATHMAADLAGLEQVAAWSQSPEGKAPWEAAVARLREIIERGR